MLRFIVLFVFLFQDWSGIAEKFGGWLYVMFMSWNLMIEVCVVAFTKKGTLHIPFVAEHVLRYAVKLDVKFIMVVVLYVPVKFHILAVSRKTSGLVITFSPS